MARCCLVKLSLAVCVGLAVAWTLAGQPPPDTRDNFHGKASKLPRLSPEELDKKLEADFAKEAKTDKQDKKAKEKSPPDTTAAGGVPAHRQSHDVLAKHPAAKKQKFKEFQITLKNWFI